MIGKLNPSKIGKVSNSQISQYDGLNYTPQERPIMTISIIRVGFIFNAVQFYFGSYNTFNAIFSKQTTNRTQFRNKMSACKKYEKS